MDRLGEREKLTGFEKVKRFTIFNEDFTPENGILTATMKLKRHDAKLRFQKDIDRMYKQVAMSKL